MTRLLVSFSILLLFSFPLVAQSLGSGNCDLTVRVRTSDERVIQGPIQVQVLDSQGVVATTQVVGDQSAEFHVANGKTYRLTVSGTVIDTITTSYFQINDLEPTHTEIVHVKVTKDNPDEESTSGSPTVSVSEMQVPRKASSEMDKGLSAYSKGDMDKASEHFNKAVAEYPNYARAYDMLGAIAIKKSDRGNARELFSKSMQVDATFLPAYVDLARMDVQEQKYDESKSLLGTVISKNASMADAVSLLAITEFANKEYDKALVDVQRAHALHNHEQFAEIHIMAGKVLRMRNHPDAAIAQFQLFLKEKPDSPEAASVRQQLASLGAQAQP